MQFSNRKWGWLSACALEADLPGGCKYYKRSDGVNWQWKCRDRSTMYYRTNLTPNPPHYRKTPRPFHLFILPRFKLFFYHWFDKFGFASDKVACVTKHFNIKAYMFVGRYSTLHWQKRSSSRSDLLTPFKWEAHRSSVGADRLECRRISSSTRYRIPSFEPAASQQLTS